VKWQVWGRKQPWLNLRRHPPLALWDWKIPYKQPLPVPSGAAQSRVTAPTRRQERSASAADGSFMPLRTKVAYFSNSHYRTKFTDLDWLRGCCYSGAIFIIGKYWVAEMSVALKKYPIISLKACGLEQSTEDCMYIESETGKCLKWYTLLLLE
jgi:hypothetical protein